MQVIGKINQRRLGKVYFAARGRDTREWMMKREQLSPRYTTCISELPKVKASPWKGGTDPKKPGSKRFRL